MTDIFYRKFRSLKVRLRRYVLNQYWKLRDVKSTKQNHLLPGELIVSLTSYPPRFATLAPVLKTVLSQSVKPDYVVLWVAHEDKSLLPKNVLALQEKGLSIKSCADIRSYKKIIPTLENYPDAYIVTADDDILYECDWLKILVSEYRNPFEVLFRRGHTITFDENNHPRPYREWLWESTSSESSSLSFPTSGAGALYPPRVFNSRVTDTELFMQLAPNADDLWLFWMASLGGARFRRVGPERYPLTIVTRSQRETLGSVNNGHDDQNTSQLIRLVNYFGIPWSYGREDLPDAET